MSIEKSRSYSSEIPSKLGIAIAPELCYTVIVEANRDRGVLLLNAVNSTQYIIVGKAPLVSGLTSRCSLRQRRQTNRGRFVMSEINLSEDEKRERKRELWRRQWYERHGGKPRKGPETRFWEKVDKDGPTMPHMDTPCWVWTGRKRYDGYGKITVSGRGIRTHRLSYELHFGPIPDGLGVLHKCDNRSCVRPDHLYVGNAFDNAQDMRARGRRRKPNNSGEINGHSKLTEKDVLYIREQWANRKTTRVTQTQLAAERNVSQSLIYQVVHRKIWRHI